MVDGSFPVQLHCHQRLVLSMRRKNPEDIEVDRLIEVIIPVNIVRSIKDSHKGKGDRDGKECFWIFNILCEKKTTRAISSNPKPPLQMAALSVWPNFRLGHCRLCKYHTQADNTSFEVPQSMTTSMATLSSP